MTRAAQLLLGVVMAAGLVVAVAELRTAATQPTLSWTHVLLLLGLAIFATLLVVLRLVRPTRQATSGVSTLVLFGALLLTGPETVMLVLAVVAVDVALRPRSQRSPWFVTGFNTSQFLLAAIAAHWVNLDFHQGARLSSLAQPVVAAVPAVVVFFCVSYSLVWLAHRIVYPIAGGFSSLLFGDGLEEAALLMIAALARAAWAIDPWLSLLACGPVLLFWRLYQTVARLEYANNHLTETQAVAIDGLVQALAARDNEVSGHSQRVAESTRILAEALGVEVGTPEHEEIVRGALLHDVGKIGVRDAVLHKPGPLTADEWIEMRDHAKRGAALVKAYPFLARPARIVLAHHERWDGKGYPRGLAGEEIPFGARVFAVADTFDAITSPRPYKPARSIDDAVGEILRCGGTQFDPRVVECFLLHYQELPLAPRTMPRALPAMDVPGATPPVAVPDQPALRPA